jgi:[ribosomal protein S18]-alanine N-acetyltransferase
MTIFRRGDAHDLAAIAEIQADSPEAASWEPGNYNLLIGENDGRAVGFLVWRAIDAAECELLNLAVAPAFRRRGIARGLVDALRREAPGDIFLEVRESNTAARQLYKSLGFQEVNVRRKYYHFPEESGIVMKFHS